MKLGLVRRGFSGTGGAEAYLKRFADGVAAAGHECVLFTTSDWPAGEWPWEIERVRHGDSPLEFALEIVEKRPEQRCDFLFSLERVLRCDCYRAGDGVHAAWMERRAPYEARWRAWLRSRSGKHYELLRLEETMFRGEAAGGVIANSQMVKEEIIAHFGYPAERIHVVYNGVPAPLSPEESAKARAEVRAELGLGEEQFVALFAGSGWERKGLQFAVEAMNEIAGSQSACLLVAGSGRAKRMPRSGCTRYLGPVPGLARFLAAADVFLLPTLYDPFSNACLEALAAGLPVITTKANGFAEIIQNGADGEVVAEPADVLGLARAVERWMPRDRREGARERLRGLGARFSVEENVRQTLGVIEVMRGARA